MVTLAFKISDKTIPLTWHFKQIAEMKHQTNKRLIIVRIVCVLNICQYIFYILYILQVSSPIYCIFCSKDKPPLSSGGSGGRARVRPRDHATTASSSEEDKNNVAVPNVSEVCRCSKKRASRLLCYVSISWITKYSRAKYTCTHHARYPVGNIRIEVTLRQCCQN